MWVRGYDSSKKAELHVENKPKEPRPCTSQWSQQTPKEAFAAAMQSWRPSCEKCLRLQGDYIEK